MESLIGKTIDNYSILEVIGRGGMGVVLKALDTSLEKIVALKMIDPFLARDGNFVRRFKTEAKALAKLENDSDLILSMENIDLAWFLDIARPAPWEADSSALLFPLPFTMKAGVAMLPGITPMSP